MNRMNSVIHDSVSLLTIYIISWKIPKKWKKKMDNHRKNYEPLHILSINQERLKEWGGEEKEIIKSIKNRNVSTKKVGEEEHKENA